MKGIVCLATAMLVAAFSFSARLADAAQTPTPSDEYQSLRREYYRLIDSIKHPDKWREAVAQQEAFLAEVQAAMKEKAEPGEKLRELAASVEQGIAYDGIKIRDANNPFRPEHVQPFGDDLDVVAWVEDDNLRVAVGNPSDAAKKMQVSLTEYAGAGRKKPLKDWPSVAATELEVAPEEVVIVHFDGLPTTGNARDDRGHSFLPTVALSGDDQTTVRKVIVQDTGGWADGAAGYATSEGVMQFIVPDEGSIRPSGELTIYVPKQAQCRRAGRSARLVPLDKTKVITAEHGYFVVKQVAAFALDLPEPDSYDLISVSDFVGYSQSCCMSMLDLKPGLRVMRLGKAARVRRVTVPLPAESRLDAQPLSDDPVKRTQQLVTRLPSQLWLIRRNARRRIADIGPPAVPVMIDLLCSAQSGYRDNYSDTLKLIGEPAIGAVAKLLDHEKRDIRVEAAEVLGEIGGRGVDLLLKAASSKRPEVRQAAVRGLSAIGDERCREAINNLLKDPDPKVCFRAAEALRRFGGTIEQCRPLFQALEHPSPKVRTTVVHSLAWWNGKWHTPDRTPDERAPRIAEMLKDADETVREAAAGALGELADQRTTSALIKATTDRSAKLRGTAVLSLARYADPRAIPALIKAARDDDPEVRRAVGWALQYRLRHGDEGNTAIVPTCIEFLFDTDDDVRVYGAHLLGRLKAQIAVPHLERALKDPEPKVRQKAKEALTELGRELETLPGEQRHRLVVPPDPKPLPADIATLIECLSAETERRRSAAGDELAKRGERAIDALTQALNDKRLIVRLSAAETLDRIDLPAAREVLEPLMAGNDKLLSRFAAEALARSPSKEIIPTWIRLLSNDDFQLRACAAEALGRMGRKQFTTVLLEHLDDPRAEVRHKVIWALGELRTPAVLDVLFERFVNRQGGNLDRRTKPVYKEYQDHAADRAALGEALVKFGGDAVSKLIPATERSASAVQALVQIGRPAVAPLIGALKSREYRTRTGAATALGRMTPLEAVVPLARAAGGRQRDQMAAFEALTKYGRPAIPKLRDALADEELNMLAHASVAALLMNFGDDSGKEIIALVIEEGDAGEMNAIASRMGKLRKRGFLPFIEKALQRPDAWQAVAYAAAFCGGKEAIPMLKKALDHPNKGVRSGARSWIDRLSK